MGTQRSCPPQPSRDVDGNDISGTPLFSWGRRRAADRWMRRTKVAPDRPRGGDRRTS